jgi:hypothetical protein
LGGITALTLPNTINHLKRMKTKSDQCRTRLFPFAFSLLVLPAVAATVTVDFEDGAGRGGVAIATNYTHLGLTFSNAVWITPNYIGPSYTPSNWFAGSAGFGTQSGTLSPDWAYPGLDHPISLLFDPPVVWVSIAAFNVGGNGVRAQAFGAAGALIGTATADGSGYGGLNNPVLLLTNTAAPIWRVALDQYNWTGLNDGVAFDNVSFEAIPGPYMSIRVSEVEVCWTSTTGATYRVEYRSDLTTNIWTTLTNCVLSTGSEICIYDKVRRAEPQRFYRVAATNCVSGP